MTRRDKVRHLERYLVIADRIKVIRAKSEKCTPTYGAVVVSGSRSADKLTSNTQKIIDLEAEQDALVNAIAELDCHDMRHVLFCRYIRGMTHCGIAKEMGCTDRWARAMVQKAIDALKL